MNIKIKRAGIDISLGWDRSAGLLSIGYGESGLHLIVQRRHWMWGQEQSWYDGPLYFIGGGPLFLFVSQSEHLDRWFPRDKCRT